MQIIILTGCLIRDPKLDYCTRRSNRFTFAALPQADTDAHFSKRSFGTCCSKRLMKVSRGVQLRESMSSPSYSTRTNCFPFLSLQTYSRWYESKRLPSVLKDGPRRQTQIQAWASVMGISQVLPRCALWNYRGQRTVQEDASGLGGRARAQRTSHLRIS